MMTVQNSHEQILEELIKIVEDMKNHSKVEYNFYIDKLDIHSPKLDELNYFLENIDIKELSGAMNIGNTFGNTIKQGQKSNQKSKKQKNKDKNETNDIKVFINGKAVGHTITNQGGT